MRRKSLLAILAVALAGGLPALGQGSGQNPPRIYSVSFTLQPYIGDPSFDFSESFDFFSFFFGFYAPLGFWGAERPFDPDTQLAQELDLVKVTMIVTDEDLPDPNDPNAQQGDLKFYYRLDAFGSTGPPAAPPLIGATDRKYTLYVQPRRFGPPPPKAVEMLVYLWIPKFLGTNQARLRGAVDYDVLWSVDLRVANGDSPKVGEWDATQFVLKAIENNRFLPPNPPPYADAGPDQRAKVGSPVRLDGSRSFDSSNLGFDPNDPSVFSKDTLEYTWEWMSGPEKVDPQPDPNAGPNSPYALVTLNTLTTNDNPYIYRLSVSDRVNTPPSMAIVHITVLTDLPPNHAPTAVILGADGQRLDLSVPVQAKVGDTLSFKALAGADGADPDGDTLSYRWRQTNAVGGALQPDEVLAGFQPLQGIDQQIVIWKATAAGAFYLALTVVDPGGLSSSAMVTISVADAASGGNQYSSTQSPLTRNSQSTSSGDSSPSPSAAPTACGAGSLLPLALVPGVLGLLRRRRR